MVRRLARSESSRDSARTPVQWSDAEHAGFSDREPWFQVNPNYTRINVAAQEKDADSVLHFYRNCLELRKKSNTLLYGDYREYLSRHDKIYFYARVWKNIHYLIVCNFTKDTVPVKLPRLYADKKLYPVLCNYAQTGDPSRQDAFTMRPYEARVVRCRCGK